MRRFAQVVMLGAIAACGPSAPKRAGDAIIASTPTPATDAAPRSEVEIDRDDVAAWTMWRSGRRSEAMTVFQQLVRELRGQPTKSGSPVNVSTGACCELAVSADGTRAVAIMTIGRWGIYLFDGAGTPLTYVAARASTVASLTQALFVINADGMTIIDGKDQADVLHVPDAVFGTSTSGETVVYQEHSTVGHPKLHVWDAATRRDRRAFRVPDGEACSSDIAVSPDEEAFSCSLELKEGVNAAGEQTIEENIAIFDGASPRLVFPRALPPGRPSYSRDRRWIAFAHDTELTLIDRVTHKVHTRSMQGSMTLTMFSNSGKLLIAGSGLELLILDVPSLNLRARTSPVRAPAPGSADLDVISDMEIIGDDQAVWAIAEAAPDAVFRLPSGTLDPSMHWQAPTPTRLEVMTKKMETVLESTVCTVNDRIYPIDACR